MSDHDEQIRLNERARIAARLAAHVTPTHHTSHTYRAMAWLVLHDFEGSPFDDPSLRALVDEMALYLAGEDAAIEQLPKDQKIAEADRDSKTMRDSLAAIPEWLRRRLAQAGDPS